MKFISLKAIAFMSLALLYGKPSLSNDTVYVKFINRTLVFKSDYTTLKINKALYIFAKSEGKLVCYSIKNDKVIAQGKLKLDSIKADTALRDGYWLYFTSPTKYERVFYNNDNVFNDDVPVIEKNNNPLMRNKD